MSGTARMNGIPYRPKDKVPVPETGPVMENQPEPVFYDKNGIVYPKTKKLRVVKATTTKPKTAKSKVTKPGLRVHVEPTTEQNKPMPPTTVVSPVVVPAVGPDTNVSVPTYAPIETTKSRFMPWKKS